VAYPHRDDIRVFEACIVMGGILFTNRQRFCDKFRKSAAENVSVESVMKKEAQGNPGGEQVLIDSPLFPLVL